MLAELAQFSAQLARIEAKVDALVEKPKAHLTRRDFAKLANLSPRTVSRKIDAGLILTVKGRIPHSELRKFVS